MEILVVEEKAEQKIEYLEAEKGLLVYLTHLEQLEEVLEWL